jgi:hypothetical protein
LTKVLFFTGCGILYKTAQTTWPGTGITITNLAIFTAASICVMKFLQCTPKLEGWLKCCIPIFLGGILNSVVVLANGGFMPSTCQDVASGFYIPIDGARLVYLSDWLWTFVSPGDVLMIAGFLAIGLTMMRNQHPQKLLGRQIGEVR